MNEHDTTTAPVPSGQADSLSRSFLSGQDAIGAHIPEPARFPSHADEADHLLGIQQDSADNIAAYLADLRNDVINGAMATMKVRGELNFVYGWLGQMTQLDNDAAWRPLITAIMGHIDRALSEGAATS